MNSTTAKVALLSYCRYEKKMPYVATEVETKAGCLADVLASDGKSLTEFEVKISVQDFVNDFKKPKHLFYSPDPIEWDETGYVGEKHGTRFVIDRKVSFCTLYMNDRVVQTFNSHEAAKQYVDTRFVANETTPNMMYYVIPEIMEEKLSEKVLGTLHESYGIMTFTDHMYGGIKVVRKAKKLHSNGVSQRALLVLCKRMASELATLSLNHYSQNLFWTSMGKSLEQKLKIDDGIEDFVGSP
jgi:hypothetical protein